MPHYLITLSLGPVQSLIEAARRTRDLWCGSWLLSESARAAAAELHKQHPGCLIFPCPELPEQELRPQQRPGDDANIANILRAEVTLNSPQDAANLCQDAKQAAQSRLATLCEQARQRVDQLGGTALRADIWDTQVNDILESFSAWVEVGDGEGAYRNASPRLGGILATRKATRDFCPAPPPPTPGLPKSSLDGGRETVLPKDWPEQHAARLRLGLSKGEHLDALGVAKRLAGDAEQFTAYTRIAAHPWISGLDEEQRQRLCEAYEPLVGLGLATRTRGNNNAYSALPYDAALLYPFRLENALSAANDKQRPALLALRKALRAIAEPRQQAGGPTPAGYPVPYAAILKADGDRMGKLLGQADSAERSRAISRALHGFASSVRGIVRDKGGHAIYAGGDDVLAMLPLQTANACAKELAATFHAAMDPVADRLGIAYSERPTLSAGLGIGHLMEPLGSLRERAERAEKRAKGNGLPDTRNALAIILGIRAGADYVWRAQWTDSDAHDALRDFTDAYRKPRPRLPSRIAFDLRAADLRLAWLRNDSSDTADGMRRAEVERTLDRARIEGGEREIAAPERTLIVARSQLQALPALADTLLIARWQSARSAADIGDLE